MLLFLVALFLTPTAQPRIDGVALSPHFERPAEGLTFSRMVDEIAGLGANHISVVTQWSQADVRSVTIKPDPKETPSDATLEAIIKRSQAKGLKVMLFPILWVEKRGIGEWRGTLSPVHLDAWWASYTQFLLHYARMAERHKVAVLSVGSEFASLEGDRERWASLIKQVRGVYSGKLIYSANWDHYAEVTFWDLVDQVGLTGYYRLSEKWQPEQVELDAAWRAIRDRLVVWQRTHGKKLIFTELGYPSIVGAARSPWDYTGSQPADPEGQRRCFEAFVRAWRDVPALQGVYFWNWFGPGGVKDRWYTPRGKPAEAVMKRWFAR